MTDLCLTLVTLTGSELSNILWLTFRIFALWRILLPQLKMKRPKAMAALQRAFPSQEWDVLTTTTDTQISDDNKLNPAAWLQEQTKHYLGAVSYTHLTLPTNREV